MKSVQMRSLSWSVFSRIWTEYREKCRKIRTRKNSVFGHFSRSVSKQNISYTMKSVISLSSHVTFYKRFSFTLNYIRFLSVFGTLRVAVNQISQDPVCTPRRHNECASLDNVLQRSMINQYSSNKKYFLLLRVTLSIICVCHFQYPGTHYNRSIHVCQFWQNPFHSLQIFFLDFVLYLTYVITNPMFFAVSAVGENYILWEVFSTSSRIDSRNLSTRLLPGW